MSLNPQTVLWGLWSLLSLNESHLLGFCCGGGGEQSEVHSRKSVLRTCLFVWFTEEILLGYSDAMCVKMIYRVI